MRPTIGVGALDYPLHVRRHRTLDAASVVQLPSNVPVAAAVLVHRDSVLMKNMNVVTDVSRLSKHAAEL
jgi:hypothetical protein